MPAPFLTRAFVAWFLPVLIGVPAGIAAPIQADLHVDTPTQMVRKNIGLDAAELESGLPNMMAGGTTLVVEVLWPPREGDWAAQVDRLFTKLEAEDARLNLVEHARSPDEARGITAAGHVALVVSLEGAHGLGTASWEAGGREALHTLHDRGLSLLGLTWSFSNRYAGSSGDGGGGLTEEGRALVAEANRLGIVLDVSHASKATTLEVCAASKAPVIASHSDAWGLTPHARNLSDEEIVCIARIGGVIGVNFHATFVGRPASASRVADHLDYLRRVGGGGVVALGSDYDGLILPPSDLATAAALPALWTELRRRGWTEDEMAGVRGENFLRAWGAVGKVAGGASGNGGAPPG